MRGLTSRGAEGAACNVNSIAGPLAACGMACGGAILSARKRAMEPWSQRARLGAWRLRWIACGRARHSLSSVGVVVVLVHFVCRNAHLSSCHVSIVRSSGGEPRPGPRLSLRPTCADCRVGRALYIVIRVQSGGAAARIPVPRPSGTSHRSVSGPPSSRGCRLINT
jgi:hypothetical protein